ncbi:MAG: sn-glycerol-1-phosphate dehydrogenase [Candidatus Altiarchaeota archaeon]|nr:sn-glycerol-1-phosphate dehydrogenase [Candidatus Altiarchaeota archaeon]
MKYIELPRKVLVGDGALAKIPDVLKDLKLSGKSVLAADIVTERIAGERIAGMLASEVFIVSGSGMPDVDRLAGESVGCGFIVACGGGAVNDVAKLASFRNGIPYINVPTSASHDGIASPQASLKGEKPVSVRAQCPLGVVADTALIKKSPARLTSSGCADAISNYTAVLDWKLAHNEKGEYYGDYAAALSEMSARIVMDNAGKIKSNVSILVEALISSGVAIGIAGSSRPCSGSEHAFSHALDLICENPALHGEQCGVGAIMMAYLQKSDWQAVKKSLEWCGAPTNAEQMGISRRDVIRALSTAHKVRDRYTILRDGISRSKAEEIAEKTGVI